MSGHKMSGHEPEPERSYASSSIDELLENSAAYAAEFAGPSTRVPSKAVAIVTCMDTRIDVFRIFGLDPGDAHVLRVRLRGPAGLGDDLRWAHSEPCQ